MTTSQVAPPPVAPVRVQRGPRRLLRALLGFFVFVLGLGLSFASNPTAAQAWTAPPAPVVIAGATRAAPLLAATANPVGLTLSALAFLGIAAYETRDSWMPVLKNAFNPTEPTTGVQPPSQTLVSNGCSFESQVIQLVDGGGSPELGRGSIITKWSCVKENYPEFSPAVSTDFYAQCRSASGAVSDWTFSENPIAYQEEGTFSYGNMTRHTAEVVLEMTKPLCDVGVPVAIKTITNDLFESTLVGLNGGVSDDLFVQTAEVTCRKPDGTLVTLNESNTGQPDRIAVPSCEAAFPGSIPWSVSIKGGPQGQVPRELVKLDTRQDLFDEYADCFGPTGLVCEIKVFVDGQACTFGDALCERWWDIQRAEPERVQCKFGTHVVGIGQCDLMKRAYRDVHTVTRVDTKTGDPVTDPDTEVVTDPVDPERPPPDPNPETPQPEVDPENPDGSKQQNCNASELSWNPISWVVVPLQCVFIPSEGIGSRADRLKDRYKGRAPFAFLTPVVGMAYGVSSECPDWRIKVLPGQAAYDANVVCESSFTAAIRNARPFLVAGGIALAFWPLVRGVLYASVPIVKPTPTDGK